MVKYRTGKQRGYGFNKTRIVREYNGNNSNYEHYNNSSYERYNNSNYEHYNNSNYGHYNNSHNNVQEGNTIEEEVFIVRNESNVNFIPPTPSFKQASSFSMTQLMNNNNNSIQDFNTRPSKDINEDEQAGFFFDLSAQQNTENNRGLGYNKTDKKQAAFLKHKKKIIQDENVYIDDDDENDDVLSISSSEDIEIIKGLSHWANKDILRDEANDNSESIDAINQDNQFEMGDLIQMLKTMLISDICDNEKPRVNTQNTFRSNRKSNPPPMSIKKYITENLIKNKDIKTLRLHNVTPFGLNTIIPELAELYKLQYFTETIPNHYNNGKSDSIVIVDLVRTEFTSKPDYRKRKAQRKKFLEKHNLPVESFMKSNKKSNPELGQSFIKSNTKSSPELDQRPQKQKKQQRIVEVASNSAPISSSNVGHRMLAAMGWKEGEGIGSSNSNGIKEPIKAYVRVNRRGLGA